MSAILPSYDDLTGILERLPLLAREARRARRLSLREAAEQIGISFNTLSRVEHGADCHLSAAVAILRWLGSGVPS